MSGCRYHALCTMPVRSAHCFCILWPVRPIPPVCSAHLTAEVLPLWSTSVFRVESTHSAQTLRSIRWYSLIFLDDLQSAATFDAYDSYNTAPYLSQLTNMSTRRFDNRWVLILLQVICNSKILKQFSKLTNTLIYFLFRIICVDQSSRCVCQRISIS